MSYRCAERQCKSSTCRVYTQICNARRRLSRRKFRVAVPCHLMLVYLQDLVDLGLVTEQELSDSIATEFNPVHIGFYDEEKRHPDIVAHDVLNLGVNPRSLLFHLLSFVLNNLRPTSYAQCSDKSTHPDEPCLPDEMVFPHRVLLSHMRARFLDKGGVIFEGTAFHTAEVYPGGVVIK